MESSRQKNAIFWSKFSQISLKPPLFKFGPRRTEFGHDRVFLVLWEISKNQFGRPGKNVEKNFLKLFQNPHPPIGKILDSPFFVHKKQFMRFYYLLILEVLQNTKAPVVF